MLATHRDAAEKPHWLAAQAPKSICGKKSVQLRGRESFESG
jgi:hypothetical protein